MNYPTTIEPSNIKITSISPTLVSVTHSLKRQVRRRGGQRWALEVVYPLVSREEFAPIWAFKIAQQGQFKTFNYVPHTYGNTSGGATSEVVVSGNYSAGDNTLNILTNTWAYPILSVDEYPDLVDVWGLIDSEVLGTIVTCSDPTYTDEVSCLNGSLLKAGDFIKFSGHDKVYMLMTDSSSTLTIEPALHENVVDGEQVIYNDVPFKVAFTGDTTEMEMSTNKLISHSVNLVEIV